MTTNARQIHMQAFRLVLGGLILIGAATALGQNVRIPLSPPAPTDEQECRDFQNRIQALQTELHRQKSNAGTSIHWKTSPAPNCSEGTTYGPPEWAPFDDALCAAHNAKMEGFRDCMTKVATHKQFIRAEVQTYQRNSLLFGQEYGSRAVSEWADKNDKIGAFALRSYGRASGTLEFASALLSLAAGDTPAEDRITASLTLFKGAEFGFKENPIAALMSSLAAGLIDREYRKAMAELQYNLAQFDATAAIEVPLSFQSNYQKSYIRDLQTFQDAVAGHRAIEAQFGGDRVTHIGDYVSRSAHSRRIDSEREYDHLAGNRAPPDAPDQGGDSFWGSVLQGVLEGAVNAQQQAAQRPPPPSTQGNRSASSSDCSANKRNCSVGSDGVCRCYTK